MDFIDQLKQLGERVQKLKVHIQTEEATKHSLIMPFIDALGYDVYNPVEVVPEFVADLGTKKGEKVDYAIFKDGNPILLIECKWWGENLDNHSSQLFRYFHVTKAKFGLLTNGIQYRFFTDIEETNKMDEKPFLEFDISDIKEQVVPELKKFHKSYFDAEAIFSAASELKYGNEIRLILGNEFKNPSDAFVKLFANKVYEGRITEKVLTQFTEIVRKAVAQHISDTINERLKSAQIKEGEATTTTPTPEGISDVDHKEPKIETTQEETDSFNIVRGILFSTIDPSRITFKDTVNYFGITLDGKSNKIICRLYLNSKQKRYLALFDHKVEEKVQIDGLGDIFKYSERLKATALQLDDQK